MIMESEIETHFFRVQEFCIGKNVCVPLVLSFINFFIDTYSLSSNLSNCHIFYIIPKKRISIGSCNCIIKLHSNFRDVKKGKNMCVLELIYCVHWVSFI